MPDRRKDKIKRILVALDDTEKAISLLREAAALAESLNAELIGLFVEDINLLRAAELPFFQEVTFTTRTRRRVDRAQIERILEERANELRSEAEQLLGEIHIDWSIAIRRGSVSEEIQKASTNVDMLVMARSTISYRHLGSTARQVTQELPVSVLLIEPETQPYRDFLTVYDGSEKSIQAMEAAILLAEAQNAVLTIAIVAGTKLDASRLQREAAALLRERGAMAAFRWVMPPHPERLAEIVAAEGSCMLVLPEKSVILEHNDISEILHEFNCPVFLVG